MTDIDYDTWMLSGSSVMRDGVTIMNNYRCDLDSLGVGTRVGMMRHSDGSLHYYVNGEDQGTACENLPPGKSWVVTYIVSLSSDLFRHSESLCVLLLYLGTCVLSQNPVLLTPTLVRHICFIHGPYWIFTLLLSLGISPWILPQIEESHFPHQKIYTLFWSQFLVHPVYSGSYSVQ